MPGRLWWDLDKFFLVSKPGLPGRLPGRFWWDLVEKSLKIFMPRKPPLVLERFCPRRRGTAARSYGGTTAGLIGALWGINLGLPGSLPGRSHLPGRLNLPGRLPGRFLNRLAG